MGSWRPRLCAMIPSAAMVRTKIDAGVLPADLPVKLWAGHGGGELCAVCEEPIVEAQTEYEVQYVQGPPIKFHIHCHQLWDSERRRRG